MRLVTEESAYGFPASRYEDAELPPIDYEVNVLTEISDMKDAIQGSGTCLDKKVKNTVDNDDRVLNSILEVFSGQDEVNFYEVGNRYARSLEFDTPNLDVMAVDAAPVGETFEAEAYRAGINAIMRHAEVQEKDAIIGGCEFFYDRHGTPFEIGCVKPEFLGPDYSPEFPATEVFFDDGIPIEQIGIPSWINENGYEEWATAKGEDWMSLDEVLIRRL